MGSSDSDQLKLTSEEKKDPLTQSRETDLWNRSKALAAVNPFEGQYGGASAMPGMSAMSGAGQQYLADSILGPGQYSAQNLGFTDYARPESAGNSSAEQIAEAQAAARQRAEAQRLRDEAILAQRTEQGYKGEGTYSSASTRGVTGYGDTGKMGFSVKTPGTLATAVGFGTAPAPVAGLLGSRGEEEGLRAPGPTRVGPNDPGW